MTRPLRCLIGRVPFKYHIMTIGGVPPQLINHGLLIRGWHYIWIEGLKKGWIFHELGIGSILVNCSLPGLCLGIIPKTRQHGQHVWFWNHYDLSRGDVSPSNLSHEPYRHQILWIIMWWVLKMGHPHNHGFQYAKKSNLDDSHDLGNFHLAIDLGWLIDS